MRRVSLHGFKSFTFENTLISKLHVVYEELQKHPALDLDGFGSQQTLPMLLRLLSVLSIFRYYHLLSH